MRAYNWDVNWVIYFGSVCLGGGSLYTGDVLTGVYGTPCL